VGGKKRKKPFDRFRARKKPFDWLRARKKEKREKKQIIAG